VSFLIAIEKHILPGNLLLVRRVYIIGIVISLWGTGIPIISPYLIMHLNKTEDMAELCGGISWK
jgi:hypothetical protein